jgi:tetratricopeptide (TPR) repeat protein
MSPIKFSERKSEKLAAKGYKHLEEGDVQAALTVAAELEIRHYTAAFEIAALAHAQLGELEAAVATLERGVGLEPDCWINWKLLGDYRSDLERYDDAALAYETALRCYSPWESLIRLNQAILAVRRGLYAQALLYAAQTTDPDLAVRAASVRVNALVGMGQPDDALRVGHGALTEIDTGDPEDFAVLAASVAEAQMAQGVPAKELLVFVLNALEQYDPTCKQLLVLVRIADDQYSVNARYYRIMIDARMPFIDPESGESEGYIVTYDVVADSVDEALTFIDRLEDPVVRGKLIVSEHEALEDRPDSPKGVYRRTPRFYYSDDDKSATD